MSMMPVEPGMALLDGERAEVHWPLPGQMIPLANEVLDMPGLPTLCGRELYSGDDYMAGVGHVGILLDFEEHDRVALNWCPICFPEGRPRR